MRKIAISIVIMMTGIGIVKVSAQTTPQADPAAAADAGSPNYAPEREKEASLREVIVTAQKFAQPAFDVPMSLAAISGPDLQQDLIRSLDDLPAAVPGLTVVDNGSTSYVYLRGVSNLYGEGARVGSYLDEADVTTWSSIALNLETYDLQRVEVLKGPQGTLYGEGSIGGTIRYITNRPVLDRVQLTADATATFDQYGAPGQGIVAVINTPVVTNNFGIRVAADVDHEGGWIDQPTANQKNINGQDLVDARIEALWNPTPDFTVNVMQVIHRAADGTFIGETNPGIYAQPFGFTTTPSIDNNYNVSNLTMKWQGRHVQVLNTLTHFTSDLHSKSFSFSFQFTPPPSPAIDEYIPQSRYLMRGTSDELRFESGDKDTLHWIVGAFYRNFNVSYLPIIYYYGIPGPPGSPPPGPYGPAGTAFSTPSKSWSVFGDMSYQLFNRLTIGAGARVFRDDEHYLAAGAQTQSGTFKSTDPRFYIQYKITGDVNLYASATKGFRSGGFNSFGYPPYRPESVWTYELGSKVRLLHRRVNASADVFWSNYDGYQIYGISLPPAPPEDYQRNGGTARIKGVEGDVRWSPMSGWIVGVSGDYIDGRFVKLNLLYSGYEVGDPLDSVPRYQITGSGERDFSLVGRPALARLEYSQTARMTYRDRAIGPWYYGQSDYIYLLNFQAGLQWNPGLRYEVFARNLLNDRGYTGPYAIIGNAAREQPRTFGFEVTLSVE